MPKYNVCFRDCCVFKLFISGSSMSITVVKLPTNEPQKYNLSAECANSTWLRLESSNTKSSALLFQAFSQWTNLTLSYRSNLYNISQHVNGTAVGLIKVRSFLKLYISHTNVFFCKEILYCSTFVFLF